MLNLSGSYEIPFQVSEVGFAVEPHAGAKLYVLNNPAKDSDQMGVLGQGKVAGNEARLDHQIEFKDHGAWTKYELEAGVTATAGGDLSVLNLEGSISRRMLLYDYHYHQDRSTKVSDAVLGDLRDFRFAVDPKSLEKLQDQEAIAYRVPGRLSLRVEASWSTAKRKSRKSPRMASDTLVERCLDKIRARSRRDGDCRRGSLCPQDTPTLPCRPRCSDRQIQRPQRPGSERLRGQSGATAYVRILPYRTQDKPKFLTRDLTWLRSPGRSFPSSRWLDERRSGDHRHGSPN